MLIYILYILFIVNDYLKYRVLVTVYMKQSIKWREISGILCDKTVVLIKVKSEFYKVELR